MYKFNLDFVILSYDSIQQRAEKEADKYVSYSNVIV